MIGSTAPIAAAQAHEMRGKSVVGGGRSGFGRVAAAGLLGVALLSATERQARADTANDVKGTAGGAMLGAEIVMLAESAFRLRPGWMYLVGGAGGALAGGYLGYRISDGSSNRPPSFLLAGGIALIIPTIMGVLTATQYEPIGTVRQESDTGSDEADGSDDEGSPLPGELEEPPSESPEAGARAPQLGLPSIGLAQAFSRDELATFGVHQVTELHLSLLRGVF